MSVYEHSMHVVSVTYKNGLLHTKFYDNVYLGKGRKGNEIEVNLT